MLNICSDYANDHALVFDVTKSKSIVTVVRNTKSAVS